jgi:hypothetical protein
LIGLWEGVDNNAAADDEAEEEEELLPSELDPADWELGGDDDEARPSSSGVNLNGPYFASVALDHLTARYVGKGNHAHDAGTVKANRPVPRKRVSPVGSRSR